MADRKTSLDTASLTIGGTDYKALCTGYQFGVDDDQVKRKSVVDRYGKNCTVKQGGNFRISLFSENAGACQTNLDVTVFTVGGTALIGRMKSGRLSASTLRTEGAGLSSRWKFPNSVGTEYSVSGDLYISSTAPLMLLMDNASITALDVTVTMTIGVLSFECPMTLKGVVHVVEEGQIQMENCTLEMRGDPVTVSGRALFVDLMTGDSVVAFSIDTGAGTYTGDALITSGEISWSDGALIEDTYEFEVQGTPTIA